MLGTGPGRRVVVFLTEIVDRSYNDRMGRTSDARERLLASGLELIYDKGYNAVGVSEVCAKAGVNKGSFYHFYPSKQQLGLAIVDEHAASTRRRLNGLVSKVDGFERRVEKMEDRYAECPARLEAEAE